MRPSGACLAALLSAACTAPSTPAAFAFPKLPESVSMPDSAPPPLPPTGPVGRGVLLYIAEPSATHLVLESGEHFRLPSPPSGEGRHGSMKATLSLDGRWLGHRKATSFGDDRYVIRDLTGTRPTLEVTGSPQAWSPDGAFLAISDPSAGLGIQLVEPATGKTTSVRLGSSGLGGVLPGGRLLLEQSTGYERRQLRWHGNELDTTLTFATDANHECWCPSGYRLSPDGTTVAIQLHYERGTVPETKEKTSPRPLDDAVVAVYELATGKMLHRVRLPGGARWTLLADTGSGMLLRRDAPDEVTLLLLDPTTERLETLTRLPVRLNFVVGGHVLHSGV